MLLKYKFKLKKTNLIKYVGRSLKSHVFSFLFLELWQRQIIIFRVVLLLKTTKQLTRVTNNKRG